MEANILICRKEECSNRHTKLNNLSTFCYIREKKNIKQREAVYVNSICLFRSEKNRALADKLYQNMFLDTCA